MASKKTRFFMGFLAFLFLFTSSALTIAVLWQEHQNSKKDTSQVDAEQQKAIDALKAQQSKPKENTVKLAGSPLANFTPVQSISELQKIDTTPGTGDTVKAGDTVTVDYTGAVAATGIVFQSSLDTGQPVTFPLSGVIKGWTDGVPGMKVNGTRRLLIPAAQAYGANPPQGSGIPANADLVFDITLHKIGK
jgi:FKBP-type peptidyl-prolyl cis-trans isomerase